MKRLLTALVLLLTLAGASTAQASTLIMDGSQARSSYTQIADATWPDSPCVGQLIVQFGEIHTPGAAGEATGMENYADGTSFLRSCVMTVDPVQWAAMTPYARCKIVVHEAGHLDGHGHTEHGVMAPDSDDSQPFAPCDVWQPTGYRVYEVLASSAPLAVCNGWHGGRLRCTTEHDDGTHRHYYEATRAGDGFLLFTARKPIRTHKKGRS